ncbi:MAG: Type III PLP / low-specificity D-threonine aldolase [uncultured Cytophagales bacterium]|uniref:Type III PLP / low-specificity D-threonine aldolase n=1 Tax=uncultured Cytophagales bacterium TaxID=158755 RepID=A0A6J4KEU1_9SPHI|nr:MAG: Type III PLP / low-specificity D-threonine aldolase [uncultured Cytophagales bacterium]
MNPADAAAWYTLRNVDAVDSPALVVYRDRVLQNITLLKSMVEGDVASLRPHVKTHKMAEVARLLLDAGIRKFKCATIAEAEMLARTGAPDVLLAYQPAGPKIGRLLGLVRAYPETRFSCLVDNPVTAEDLAAVFAREGRVLDVFLDLNVGMNRTGIVPGREALELYFRCGVLRGIHPVGLHTYDGHIRDEDFTQRKEKSDAAFEPVGLLAREIGRAGKPQPVIVAGGSPTFPVHARRPGVERSPGTFVFWDWGYHTTLAEQPFVFAALLVTRVVSVVNGHTICLDLGHKSVAAENPLPRVKFLNLPDAQPVAQSEEHLVVKVADSSQYKVGDVFYAVPVHICPTCALYDRAHVAEDHLVTGTWKVVARDRMIEY